MINMNLINEDALHEIIHEEIMKVIPKQRNASIQQYFNVGEAGKYLGVSRTTFKRMRLEGKIKPRTVMGIERYYIKDLDKVFENENY